MSNGVPETCLKHIPAGYKQTEVGVIPEDWEEFTFDEVISFCSSGATPYRGNKSFYKGTIRWITSGELNYCTIDDTIEKISDDAVLKANLKIHPAGTFLMAITGLEAAGTRGACGIVGQPSATNQSCMAIYPNEKLITPYLYFWYTYNGENLAFKYCQGTKQLSYTAGLIKKIPLYLPVDIKEQTAIANALSDVDFLISELDKLISKKQAIKTATMQQLLTGRTRLPQFALREDGSKKGTKQSELGEIPEDWEIRTVSELGQVYTGGTPPTNISELWNGNIPWITPTDISYSKNICSSERKISRKGLQFIKPLPANSVLVTCIASIGKNAILRRDGACNQQINAMVPNKNIDIDFLFYSIELSTGRLKASAGITATLIVSKALFERFQLVIPTCPQEQKIVSTILNDMDEEIQALEQRLSKTRQIKQGMMQELLTGKTRLV